jgi:methylmalonyl-CoA mutase N-terminal domain/subunit
MSNSLDEARKKWEEEQLGPSLSQFPERKPDFATSSGISLQRLYLPSRPAPDYLERLGFPGEYPFTRGVHPSMYRGRLWTMRQYAGYASAEETNRRFRYLLQEGQTGLSVAFDLPTQIGYDADHSMASGEVGRVGVSISCLDDMQSLFKGIPLDKVSTSMTINAPAAVLLAMYIAAAKRQGVDPSCLRGTIQNDILKEYVARGTYIFPPRPALRITTDIFRFCLQEVPRWNTISISGYHMREAGATAVQELAFTLANAVAYIEAARGAGLRVDDVAPQFTFFFGAHNHLLEEVAKFRAARRLWAELMRNTYAAADPESWRLRFHTQTAGCTLSAQQPWNNVIRVTLQALAAILGGTQSLHTNSMDEALALPSEDAVRVALRTQQIIAHESGVADSVDPLGGSYAIENLTDAVEARAREYLNQIQAMGGALAAIEAGYMQREIQEAAYCTQQEIERGEQIVVGVNAFQTEEISALQTLRVDPAIEARQRKRLAKLRRKRDNARVQSLLARLRACAHGNENLMPALIDCVEADTTLGEICAVLREEWGEYRPPTTI